MASGRVSVSPPNDEPYHSPGASQEDGVDHMMEHYIGIVQQQEGGEGKEGQSGGGMERGMHGNHSKSASLGGVEPSPVTEPQKNSPSPSHGPTLHGGSATSSHQTPARVPVRHTRSSEPGDPDGQAAGGQAGRAGLGGDVRSFSWDNLATSPTTGAEGEYYITIHT